MLLASLNIGVGFAASKEKGFGVAEKRTRDVEGGSSCAGSACNSGDSFMRRAFHELPEAPLRKRVHLCESDLGVAQDEKEKYKDLSRESEGNPCAESETAVKPDEKGSDSWGNGKLPAGFSPRYGQGGEHAVGKQQDVEISPECLDGTTGEDADGEFSAVPDVKRSRTLQTENADMEVDPEYSEDNVVTVDRVGFAVEEPVSETGCCHDFGYQPMCEGGDEVKDFAEHVAERYIESAQSGGVEPPPVNDESKREEHQQDISEKYPHLVEEITLRDIPQEHSSPVEVIDVDPPPCNREFRQRNQDAKDIPEKRPSLVEVIDVSDVNDNDDVEVIQFDSDDDEDPESNGSSTKGTKPIRQNRRDYNSSAQFTSATFNHPAEESDSDDVQVLSSFPPRGPVHVLEEEEDSDSGDSLSVAEGSIPVAAEDITNDESESSDVEETVHESDIRRMWEEAAMRRRMGRAMRSEGSKANGEHGTVSLDGERAESHGLAESVSTSTYDGSPDSKDQTETSETRGVGINNETDGQQVARSTSLAEERLGMQSEGDNNVFPSFKDADEMDIPFPEVKGVSSSDAHGGGNQVLEKHDDGSMEEDESGEPIGNEDILAAKEKLKQTTHYRKADEAEWASRQQEIQRQAVAAKRLRLRKRIEADRQKEMERKQKQRVEELRRSQLKEEKRMSLREQLRGQVQMELEHIASTCNDFATLLRRFGIEVDGGSHPSIPQVNAAYKRALFKFHPDRAGASTHGDPRRQVEAEEKFKLIARLKSSLVPVAIEGSRGFR